MLRALIVAFNGVAVILLFVFTFFSGTTTAFVTCAAHTGQGSAGVAFRIIVGDPVADPRTLIGHAAGIAGKIIAVVIWIVWRDAGAIVTRLGAAFGFGLPRKIDAVFICRTSVIVLAEGEEAVRRVVYGGAKIVCGGLAAGLVRFTGAAVDIGEGRYSRGVIV